MSQHFQKTVRMYSAALSQPIYGALQLLLSWLTDKLTRTFGRAPRLGTSAHTREPTSWHEKDAGKRKRKINRKSFTFCSHFFCLSAGSWTISRVAETLECRVSGLRVEVGRETALPLQQTILSSHDLNTEAAGIIHIGRYVRKRYTASSLNMSSTILQFGVITSPSSFSVILIAKVTVATLCFKSVSKTMQPLCLDCIPSISARTYVSDLLSLFFHYSLGRTFHYNPEKEEGDECAHSALSGGRTVKRESLHLPWRSISFSFLTKHTLHSTYGRPPDRNMSLKEEG